jgi:hypothetical protein
VTRITTAVLVFMLLFNGGVTVMEGSGLSEDLGVTLAPGVDEAMDNVVDNAKDGFSASEGLGNTLFSLFAAAMGTFQLLIQGVFSFPSMLLNLGFPGWFVVPMFAPMYVISTLELIYAATGRGLV